MFRLQHAAGVAVEQSSLTTLECPYRSVPYSTREYRQARSDTCTFAMPQHASQALAWASRKAAEMQWSLRGREGHVHVVQIHARGCTTTYHPSHQQPPGNCVWSFPNPRQTHNLNGCHGQAHGSAGEKKERANNRCPLHECHAKCLGDSQRWWAGKKSKQ